FCSISIVLSGKIDAAALVSGEKNYLIVNDEASSVVLQNVDVGREAYRNGTWGIWELMRAPGVRRSFRLALSRNIIEKFKDRILGR
ncbi:MAG: hypothetical protein HQL19_03025, partial [Candidatus Omnitrophica bacterium]|nr:hypothetical protein [Candidatus Omnitrophota bacterium]